MMAGSVMSLPFTLMELILFFDFLVIFILSLIPSHVLNKLSLFSWKSFWNVIFVSFKLLFYYFALSKVFSSTHFILLIFVLSSSKANFSQHAWGCAETVCTPLSAEVLDRTSAFRGGCWERGGDFFQAGRGFNFHTKQKNKNWNI